ncbi:hypothetical protein B9Q02_09075 [Candidatus Marsarchaeota G1 archaeon BE_D]|uniref:Uncharacterized protein n=1 Tax=Candidatus Marsarchaeota G1 archaeon BE_D TaxID=1978156 RepID=A0A2R6AED0_9ARCH|nr:MAG: hypothetical protein B9Q02_09075 [Candidatus Marsarchaeota G1 archaeon BE_D]
MSDVFYTHFLSVATHCKTPSVDVVGYPPCKGFTLLPSSSLLPQGYGGYPQTFPHTAGAREVTVKGEVLESLYTFRKS